MVRPPSPEQFRNALRTLGVEPDDDWEEVRSEYKRLIRKHHPDAGGSTEKAQKINEAFQLLKEWWDKREVILGGGPGRGGPSAGGGRSRRRPGPRGRRQEDWQEEYVSWEEFFGEEFSGEQQHQQQQGWRAQMQRGGGCNCCNCLIWLILLSVLFPFLGRAGGGLIAMIARYWWVVLGLLLVWMLVDMLVRPSGDD